MSHPARIEKRLLEEARRVPMLVGKDGHLFELSKVKATPDLEIRTYCVWKDDVPVDRFSIFRPLHSREPWTAWTCDTFNETKRATRREFVTMLGGANARD